ncbi:hypothetical protein DFH05DRAFT_1592877 [Lentinula detonsa]|uniref:Uncharacterized protein n=1 Tax=Lentinula detonsa TaxID=2804962 RepID=A0A9W8P8P2_9AGAR|nr:hypothetical protein DFH05DRAFT_1592877 [Lentinula detonsa]
MDLAVGNGASGLQAEKAVVVPQEVVMLSRDVGMKPAPRKRGRRPKITNLKDKPQRKMRASDAFTVLQDTVDVASGTKASDQAGASGGPSQTESLPGNVGPKKRGRKPKGSAVYKSKISDPPPISQSAIAQENSRAVDAEEASSSGTFEVPPKANISSGDDGMKSTPKKRGRKPKQSTADQLLNQATISNPPLLQSPQEKHTFSFEAMDIAPDTGTSFSDDKGEPAPKKRGRKPKANTTNKPSKQDKTSDLYTASQSVNLKDERVSVFKDAIKQSQEQHPPENGRSRLPTPGHPVWKPIPVSLPSCGIASSIAPNVNPRPRQWCSSKEELLAILPELGNTKLVDNCPAPVILVEGCGGMSISDSKLSNDRRTVINLCVERDFACVVSDLIETASSSSQLAVAETRPTAVPVAESQSVNTVQHSEPRKGDFDLPQKPDYRDFAHPRISLPPETAIASEEYEAIQKLRLEHSSLTRISTPRNEIEREEIVLSLRDDHGETLSIFTSTNSETSSLVSAMTHHAQVGHTKESTPPPAELTKTTTGFSQAPVQSAPVDNSIHPQHEHQSSSSGQINNPLALAPNLAGIDNSAQSAFPESSLEIKGECGSTRPSLGAPERLTPGDPKNNKAVMISSMGDSAGRKRKKSHKPAKGSVTLAKSAEKISISSRAVTRSQKKAEAKEQTSGPALRSRSQLLNRKGLETRHRPPSPGPVEPKIKLKIVIPPTTRRSTLHFDQPLSPLTPLSDDISPAPHENNQPVVGSEKKDHSLPYSSRASPIEDSSPIRSWENVYMDTRQAHQKEVKSFPVASPPIPSTQDNLSVRGWNDTLYNHTDVLKKLKFTKKKTMPQNDSSAEATKVVDSTSALSFTKEQIPRTNTVGGNQRIRIKTVARLEPGEIRESHPMSSAQATTAMPPTQPRWALNQSLIMQEHPQWLAALRGPRDPDATAYNPAPIRLESGPYTPHSIPGSPFFNRSANAYATPSSSSVSLSLSASPFSIHTSSTPFTSPASGYSGSLGSDLSHYMSPNRVANMHHAFTTPDLSKPVNASHDSYTSLSDPAKELSTLIWPSSLFLCPDRNFPANALPLDKTLPHESLMTEKPFGVLREESSTSKAFGTHFVPTAPNFLSPPSTVVEQCSGVTVTEKIVPEELNTSICPSPTSLVPINPTAATISLSSSVAFPPRYKRSQKRKLPEMAKPSALPTAKRFCVKEEENSHPVRTASTHPVLFPPDQSSPVTTSTFAELCPAVAQTGLNRPSSPSPSPASMNPSFTALSSNVAFPPKSSRGQKRKAPQRENPGVLPARKRFYVPEGAGSSPSTVCSTLPVPSNPSLTSAMPSPSTAETARSLLEELDTSIQPSTGSLIPMVSTFALTGSSPPSVAFPPKSRRGRRREMEESAAKRFRASGDPFDTRVPIEVPPEIRVLVEAYTQNTPILFITSRDAMLAYCGESVGKNLSLEFQYTYLGFFKVLFVQEERVFRPSSGSAAGILVSPDYAFGRIQWKFGLEWINAGEESLGLPAHLNLDRPWWRDAMNWQNPLNVSTNQGPPSENSIMDVPASLVPTRSSSTPAIPIDILEKNEFKEESSARFLHWRQADAGDVSQLKPLCPSIVWLALLANNVSTAVTIGDIGSPRGWYCNSCGKLNRQRYFRRRKCDSSFCKDTILTACKPHRLDNIRFVGQQNPLMFPLNTMPEYIDPLVSEWDDGMRTMTYHVWNDRIVERVLDDVQIRLANSSSVTPLHFEAVDFCSRGTKQEVIETEIPNSYQDRILDLAENSNMPQMAREMKEVATKRKVVAKHIFTCNDPRLQEEQTQLLDSIQQSVILQRTSLSTTPYFSYVAGTVSEGSFLPEFIDAEVMPAPWEDVPPCIIQARSLLQHIGSTYGMSHTSSIDQLLVLGWTVTGKKKGEHCLHAKEHSVAIMALGHELGIRIVPKSGFPAIAFRMKKASVIHEDVKEQSSNLPIVAEGIMATSDFLFMNVDPNTYVTAAQDDASNNGSSVTELHSNSDESDGLMNGSSGPSPMLDPREDAIVAESSSEPSIATTRTEQIDSIIPSEYSLIQDASANGSSVMSIQQSIGMTPPICPEANFELIRMASPNPVVRYGEEILYDGENDFKSTWLKEVVDDLNGIDEHPPEHSPKSRDVTVKKKVSEKEDMHFILVHGDVLVLSGDDFDYSIERKGMGLRK